MPREAGPTQQLSLKEQEKYFIEHPDEVTVEFVQSLPEKDKPTFVDHFSNNFYTNLPGGMQRRWDSGVKGRKPRLDSRPLGAPQNQTP